jgi:A/G-specific adenine glycosylase
MKPDPDHVPVDRLLAWYDRERRDLPWRAAPGAAADPYAVWISEIMLQQTTVAAVAPRFRQFLARWPSIAELAAADLDDVLHAWQGLGYYARARNLHACARAVVAGHGGRMPRDPDALARLPGIGAYTAAAIAAIAFGRRTTPVDANVARVVARLFAVADPLPAGRARVVALAEALTPPPRRAGDFAQALMDLGAAVCTPRAPACTVCPLAGACAARRTGNPAAFPRLAAKPERPWRYGVAFWLSRPDGAVLLRRRPARGLLGGMMEVPSSPWRTEPWTFADACAAAPLPVAWTPVAGTVRHTFTHFALELAVVRGEAAAATLPADTWARPERFGEHALPTVMKKIVRLVGGDSGPALRLPTGRRRSGT